MDAGLGRIAGRVQPDGCFVAENDLGTRFRATTEALRAFREIDPASAPDTSRTFQYLNTADYGGTEYLARWIVCLAQGARSVSDQLRRLAALQNPDGGFGGDAGHQARRWIRPMPLRP